MEEWIIWMMEQFGYLGVYALMAIENLFPPIPSEVVLPLSGFMTVRTDLTMTAVIIYATSGSLTGSLLLYGIGMSISREKLETWVERHGKYLRLTKADVNKAFHWFETYGYWAVFFCRMLPLVRSFISIPAGMARFSILPFIFLTFSGSLIWNSALIYTGAVLGDSWRDIVHYMKVYSIWTYVIIIAVAFFTIWWMRKGKGVRLWR
ncbi:DedA family protein [Halobacillus litoralis]|uniref:DedA family protein n=1 Tax=Halobacillus litoralis TaxID=45668 RepID=A0A845E5H5_9BACI|nr:DedA family protein [Halobacillus litoralis]MYL50102.1 DedA family protein [Halobacillus litoralis]